MKKLRKQMINKIKKIFKDGSKRKIIVFSSVTIAALLILFSIIFFPIRYYKKSEEAKIAQLEYFEEKSMLRDELDDLIDEHNDLLYEYGDLNKQLHEKDSVIQKQITEIRGLIRTKSDLNEARKKIAALKEISKRYLANIDSLLVVNEALTFEKDSVVQANKDINWKNFKLNKENKKLEEKVSKGSVLKVLDVEIETIRYRSTGRESSTRYAKKVQKIRTCLTLAGNQISDSEIKTVYMQLINQDGQLIQKNELETTVVADTIVEYTTSSDFEYNNSEITHCFEWERIQMLLKGTYQINLIIEGNIASQKTFKLR